MISLWFTLLLTAPCKANVSVDFHERIHHRARQLVRYHEQHARELQVNVDDQCEKYNAELSNVMTCQCSRVEERDTLVNCTYIEPQCTDVACFDGGIQIYQDLSGAPYRVTTCTNITSSTATVDRLLDTCVDVNGVPGTSMGEVESCSATLNGKKCNYCHPCAATNLTIDCCNVVQDTKQEECLPVRPNGVVIPVFPAVAEDQAGQCKGSYGYSGTNSYSLSKTIVVALSSLAAVLL